MWYKVDHNKLVVLDSPIALRRPRFIALLRLAGTVLQAISDAFVFNRLRTIYKIEHTAQVCYLRGALNDAFDPELRRIRIGDRFEYDATYIYTEAEQQHRIIRTSQEVENNEDTLIIHPGTDVQGGSADFKVLVPTGLLANFFELRAMIDFYKLAGKSYVIEEY